VRTEYIKPSFKDPAQGKVTLEDKDFFDLSIPDVARQIHAGLDICKGAVVH